MVGTLSMLSVALRVQWLYVARQRRRAGEPIDAALQRRALWRFVAPNAVWALVLILAFAWPVASLVLFVASTFAYAMPFGLSK